MCTGCAACANICPKNCILMRADEEGFLYPEIDEEKCVNCNVCEKVCPINYPPEDCSVKEGYVARYNKNDVVKDSTSGGMCTAFADYVFGEGGIVYGAGYDKDMKVTHMAAYSNVDIKNLRGSKYVQSNINNSYKKIKASLEKGKIVCFFGTPCQVAGLKKFLKKEYDNLITVDLVCHGVSSPKLFEQYTDYLKNKYHSNIKDIRFRNKTYGYHSGTMKIEFESGRTYYGSARVDYMLKAYFSGACSRYSCYQCSYKKEERCSDFTIFDSWHIEKLVDGQKDDDKGYTNIFVHTDKGVRIFREISNKLIYWKADPQKMKALDGIMIENNPSINPCRDILQKKIVEAGFYDAMQEYLPIKITDYILEDLKAFAFKIGMLRKLK